ATRGCAERRGGLGDGADDVGVAGAAAQITGEPGADLDLRAGAAAANQVARADQHARRAEAALHRVAAMEAVAQGGDDRIGGEAFEAVDLALVAGNRQRQAGTRRLAVDQHRAGAAYAVLAAEMGRGQVVPVAQKIGERQARRDILGEVGTVEAEADAGHAQAWIIARNAATAWRLWRKSSNWRSAAPVKSAAIASRAAAWSSDPPLQRRGALSRVS